MKSRRGSGQIPARFGVELACRLAVASAGRMTTIFDWRRVFLVADHCMVEDR